MQIAVVIRNLAAEYDTHRVAIRDSKTGEPVYGVEWQSVLYNGKLHINICNYEWDKKNINIYINNRPVTNVSELITGSTVNMTNFDLKPFTPVLIRVE